MYVGNCQFSCTIFQNEVPIETTNRETLRVKYKHSTKDEIYCFLLFIHVFIHSFTEQIFISYHYGKGIAPGTCESLVSRIIITPKELLSL